MKALISKNFLKGIQRAVDMSGRKEWPDISEDFSEDYMAIKGDWENVGKEIKEASDKFAKLYCDLSDKILLCRQWW